MDALIPILFAIAYFIFQAYTGYQKEQEKAAKRNIGKPNPEVYKPETPDYPVQRDVTPYDPARSQGPAYEKHAYEKATYGKPAYEKPAYEKTDYQTRNIEKPYVQGYQEPAYESTYKPEKYVPTERPVSLLAEYR